MSYLTQRISELKAIIAAKEGELLGDRRVLAELEAVLEEETKTRPITALALLKPLNAVAFANAVPETQPIISRKGPPVPEGHWPGVLSRIKARKNIFTTVDAVEEIAANGKILARKSIRSRLSELVKDGVIVRVGDGVYSFPENSKIAEKKEQDGS